MIGGLVSHAIVYVVVCGVVSLVWVLLGHGDLETLRRYAAHPDEALNRDFWPIWVWLGWGVVLVIHLASVVGRMLSPRYWQRRFARARELKAQGRGPAEVFFGAAAHADDAKAKTGPQRKWVVVMFTDIAGSTSLNETLGDEAWARVLSRHREVVRQCTAEQDGREVTTQGDGFLVHFPSPRQATRAAAAIQQRCHDQRRAGEFVPEVRVGIHAGDAVHDSGDLVGQVVNLAARLLDAARPGEILVTEPVADALAGEVEFDDRGLVMLKGVTQARHLLAVNWRGTPARTGPGPGREIRSAEEIRSAREADEIVLDDESDDRRST